MSTATLIAGDDYFDGHSYERRGRNTFLYQIPNGPYFTIVLTKWPDEHDELNPIEQDEAIALYEKSLTEHRLSLGEAFPSKVVKEA